MPTTGSSTAPAESTSTSTESDSTSTSLDLAKPDPVDDVEYNDIIAQVLTDISTADGDACTLATISASFDSQPDPSTPAQTKQAVHASRALYIAMANDIPLTSDSSLAAGMRKWLSDRDVAMAAALNDPTAYLDFAITPAAQAALAAFQDETTNC